MKCVIAGVSFDERGNRVEVFKKPMEEVTETDIDTFFGKRLTDRFARRLGYIPAEEYKGQA